MKQERPAWSNVDEYIDNADEHIQPKLREIRAIIKRAAPAATETISYQMPTFNHHGYLVYFAGYKNHIGFYPTPSGMDAFEEEVARYRSGKGTLRFPLDEPLPADLITRVVKLRLQENEEKKAAKAKKKPKK